MLKIKIIVGSARPNRFSIQPANWIYSLAQERKDIEVELVDLEKINLPFLDEPKPPSRGNYEKEHTKKWAAKIAEADGFIFVTPEYNHSFSPILKNAIDFVFAEWHFKPVAFVSHGTVGGSRAVEHLRTVAAEIKMYDLREQVMLIAPWTNLDEKGQYKFTEDQVKAGNALLDSLIFWAEKMKPAREVLKVK
ncbi:NAD(P)H-dependent oxidoreductase [Candidatus Parcubacteria bacterium]|nr:NAD(P)H-dependent oxidoreductase [Candidatus Parcubacteria bacterium]